MTTSSTCIGETCEMHKAKERSPNAKVARSTAGTLLETQKSDLWRATHKVAAPEIGEANH